MRQIFHYIKEFTTESGQSMPELTIAYHTYGRLNKEKNNVVWVCHALTANSDVADWWPGVIGDGSAIDSSKYFIVCANILGSCYGTTGPLSMDTRTNKPYCHEFPLITIRDMVKAHQLLRDHLGIGNIHLLMGGSMGGYQALEWCVMEGQRIEKLFLIATSAKETPWGIAIHTAQRLAIEADTTWNDCSEAAGSKGLMAARGIGMITYRNYEIFKQTQADSDNDKIDNFRASSYIIHQGNKLSQRFNAFSYWYLTKSMDSHNLARKRNSSIQDVLASIRQQTMIVGVKTDLLCPLAETQFLADHIPSSQYHIIDSPYGHDGFITEYRQITQLLRGWLDK